MIEIVSMYLKFWNGSVGFTIFGTQIFNILWEW